MSLPKASSLKAGRPSDSKRAATLSSLADKEPTVRINFDLARADHKRLKMLAVEQERTVADLLRTMVEQLISK